MDSPCQPRSPNGPSSDHLPAERLVALQVERLRQTVRLAYDRVPLYRQRLTAAGISPDEIRSLADLARLPFITKDDLREAYPRGLFAVPLDQVVRLHASSGTTGKQVLVPYTRADLDVWTEAMLRVLTWFGVGPGDVIQNAYGYGLFTGGLGFHYGAEALGATVIPASGGNTERQIAVMQDFGATVVCCTPSFFLHMADRAQQMGVDLRAPAAARRRVRRRAVVGGDAAANPASGRHRSVRHLRAGGDRGAGRGGRMRRSSRTCTCWKITSIRRWSIRLPVRELPDGEPGELVLTTLSKQALPMLRYRTGDMTAVCPGPCPCGRTLRRIRRISHRSDDLFIVRGVNVFPAQIEAALLAVKGTLPHYQIVLSHQQGQDQAEVQVEVTPEMFSDRIGVLEELQSKLTRAIRQAVGVQLDVRLVEPRTLARSEGKARRVVDQRDTPRG